MSESWRAVVGYEGAYEVSDLGRVRSLPGGQRKGRVLKSVTAGRGYLTIQTCIEGQIRRHYIHHLVAGSFIGPRPDGLDVCHNDGDMLNNSPTNLRYDTVGGNMRDAIAHGTHRVAARTECAHGHEYTPANTRRRQTVSYDGHIKTRRVCRTCQAAHWQASNGKRKAA